MSKFFFSCGAPTVMKLPGFLFFLFLCCPGVEAQITFFTADWPATNGSYYRAYVSSDVSAPFLGVPTNTSQRWDFSSPRQPNEFVRTMDIVPTTDGGHDIDFPGASYAERFTDDVYLIWDYYRVTPNAGRTYYGSYNGGLLGASPTLMPALDIPDPISLGSNWTSSYTLEGDYIVTDQTFSAVVDAYGTIVLPQIGEVLALRVNQLTYQQVYLGGFPYGSYYFREYFWLVRGIGKAMHIVSALGPTPPPLNFTSASSVRRVFESNTLKNSLLYSVTNLSIRIQTNNVLLNWRQETNIAGYRVESLGNFNTTNWQLLAEPASNSWAGAFSATQAQQFFRVFTKP